MVKKNEMIEYELKFKKETAKAFIFTIPESGNDVLIPKSQCSIFVSSEDEAIIKGEMYLVEVAEWIAKEKKIDEGGEKQEEVKIQCKVLDNRESAIRLKWKEHDLWFPKSTISIVKEEGENMTIKLPKWLLEKKIEEENKEHTGRKVKSKVKESTDMNPEPLSDDFVEDDIPF